MGIYIYKEKTNTGLIAFYSATKPAKDVIIDKVNGQTIPSDRNEYVLLETVTIINSNFSTFGKDYKSFRDAIKTCVADLGGGDVEAGFDLLTAEEQVIAAKHNIGSGAQIASALPDLSVRDSASIEYLTKLKGCNKGVRSARAILLEALTWSRCKQFLIEVSAGVFVTMPEVIYSQITINNPNSATGELGGNLLNYYELAGIMGFAGGDKSLGILDYLYSTAGTRFAGAGIIETFAGIVPDGYANITEFRDALADILQLGELDTISTL